MLTKRQPPQIDPNAVTIMLSRGRVALIDLIDYPLISRFYWRAVKSGSCYYACARYVRSGLTYTMRMHRLIAQTPPDQVCHHENHNSLDNRRANLTNMFEDQHALEHGWI